eukprot:5087638-Lingulodinium_polyedra.AAC.1
MEELQLGQHLQNDLVQGLEGLIRNPPPTPTSGLARQMRRNEAGNTRPGLIRLPGHVPGAQHLPSNATL